MPIRVITGVNESDPITGDSHESTITSNASSRESVSESEPLPIDNRIVVNQSNYLSTIGGTIDSTKEYFIDGIVDVGTTSIVVPTTGMTLRGQSFDISGLVSTEDNYTMFVSETSLIGSGNILGQDYYIETSGVSSKVYEIYDATGFNAFEFQRVNSENYALDIVHKNEVTKKVRKDCLVNGFTLNSHYSIDLDNGFNRSISRDEVRQIFICFKDNSKQPIDAFIRMTHEGKTNNYHIKDNLIFIEHSLFNI